MGKEEGTMGGHMDSIENESTGAPIDTERTDGGNSSSSLKRVREWGTLAVAMSGLILGIANRLDRHTEKRLQAIDLVSEAWNIMGGKPGTTVIYEPLLMRTCFSRQQFYLRRHC